MARSQIQPYAFQPHERPVLPGSPYSPQHPGWRKVGYAVVGLIMALAANLNNAILTVNLQPLAGALGVTVADMTWLLAVFVAFNASANLLLIKARMQFGIAPVINILLAVYVVVVLVQMIWPTFTTALVARAVAGFTAAGLSSLVIYNFLQIFPAKIRPVAIVLAVGIPQLATPLGRFFPVELLAADAMRAIHFMELGLAFAALAGMNLLPLPPTDKVKMFDPLDALTIGLFIPAMVLLCGVLALGRTYWWTETPWLGWALAGSVLLFTAAILVEHLRRNPLLQLRWIGSLDIVRFALVALLVRLALTEQTYGSIGLLTIGGLNNDQLHGLFAVILLAMLAGTIASVLLLKPPRIPYIVLASTLIIAAGAGLDTQTSSLTRPQQLYLSQALLAFGSTLFIGPALLYGFGKVITQGQGFIVSFTVVFGLSQTLGGLAGSALLSSYQAIAARAHTEAFYSHLLAGDPQVAARLQGGASGLVQSVAREANVAAFNDVARLVMIIALGTAAYMIYIIAFNRLTGRVGATPSPQAPARP